MSWSDMIDSLPSPFLDFDHHFQRKQQKQESNINKTK